MSAATARRGKGWRTRSLSGFVPDLGSQLFHRHETAVYRCSRETWLEPGCGEKISQQLWPYYTFHAIHSQEKIGIIGGSVDKVQTNRCIRRILLVYSFVLIQAFIEARHSRRELVHQHIEESRSVNIHAESIVDRQLVRIVMQLLAPNRSFPLHSHL